ncbi:MAG: FkbM family methyltransferase, partial [Verrucomicrobiaceae bacterium]
MLVSYSQNFEDVMLWRALKHVEQGYYIDVGAQDPVTDSVSQLFYEHGWRGIHVEATQTYANKLREARPEDMVVQAAVSDQAGSLEFFEIPDSGISTGDAKLATAHRAHGFSVQKTRVPCILLRDVFELARNREIHWLKVDVEGMERQVLASWLDSPILPWIVVVESTLPMTQQSSFEDWEGYLLARQYTFAYFDGLNRFYISPSHPELASAFSSGPNVFDGFSLSGSASNSLCARLQQQHEDQEARLRKELADARSQLTHTLAVQSSIWGNYNSLKAAAMDAAVREAEMTSEAGTDVGRQTSRADADADTKRGDGQSEWSRRKIGEE